MSETVDRSAEVVEALRRLTKDLWEGRDSRPAMNAAKKLLESIGKPIYPPKAPKEA